MTVKPECDLWWETSTSASSLSQYQRKHRVPMTSSVHRDWLQCESVEIRVSTHKSEALVHCWKTVDCSLRVGCELLPQVTGLSIAGSHKWGEDGAQDGQEARCSASSNADIVPDYCGEEGVETQSFWFTGQSTFQPSPMVTAKMSFLGLP